MNKNLLRVSPSKWICKQYLLLIKYYSQCNFEWLPNLKDRLQEWKIALTSQCLTFFWVKTEINRNYYFQAKQQSTVSAAHQGMDQIPTVRIRCPLQIANTPRTVWCQRKATWDNSLQTSALNWSAQMLTLEKHWWPEIVFLKTWTPSVVSSSFRTQRWMVVSSLATSMDAIEAQVWKRIWVCFPCSS